jgi:hypothetical protein
VDCTERPSVAYYMSCMSAGVPGIYYSWFPEQTWDLGGVKPVLSSRNRPGYHPGPLYTGRVPRIFFIGFTGDRGFSGFWYIKNHSRISNVESLGDKKILGEF